MIQIGETTIDLSDPFVLTVILAGFAGLVLLIMVALALKAANRAARGECSPG